MYTQLSSHIESLATEIVDSAFSVHTSLGPGLLESIYESCLLSEIESRGIPVSNQVPYPVIYRDRTLPAGFRLDILVDNAVVLEVKSVEFLLPVHHAQLRTYLKLADVELGFLMNFNVELIKDGIKRIRISKQ